MTGDEAMRARVAGKQAKAAKIAWTLETGPLRFRCVVNTDPRAPLDGRFVVEVYDGTWVLLVTGRDAVELLQKRLTSNVVVREVSRTVARILTPGDTCAREDVPTAAAPEGDGKWRVAVLDNGVVTHKEPCKNESFARARYATVQVDWLDKPGRSYALQQKRGHKYYDVEKKRYS